MRSRKKMPRGRDKKIFRNTADSVNSKNITGAYLPRGGVRL